MFKELNCSEKLEDLINKELKAGTFPGIEILYAKGSEVLLHKTWGKIASGNSSPLLLDTIFDVASLTKPVVTTTLLLMMQEKGKLKLNDPVQIHLPEFSGRGKKQITLRHLLSHVSGLPAWENLYESVANHEEARNRLMNIPLEYSPGEKMIYSCLGFLVLGEVLRKFCTKDLSAVFYEKIAKPLKLPNSLFSPYKNRKNLNNVAPTAYCPIRNKVLHGIVHDENSFAFAEEGASDGSSMKLLGAGLAFGIAAGGAGIGLGQVGAAGLAVISENPALQSKVFIFVGMVESIAIYGIVMMFIILGQ